MRPKTVIKLEMTQIAYLVIEISISNLSGYGTVTKLVTTHLHNTEGSRNSKNSLRRESINKQYRIRIIPNVLKTIPREEKNLTDCVIISKNCTGMFFRFV